MEDGGACAGMQWTVSLGNVVIPGMVSLHGDLGRSKLSGGLTRVLTYLVTFSNKIMTIGFLFPTQLIAALFISTLLPSPYEVSSFHFNTIHTPLVPVFLFKR